MSNWLKFIPKPDIFIDCGVGVPGSEAWQLHNKWRDVKIFGFEPHAQRYDNCKKNYPGTLFNCAVGTHDHKIEMQPIDGMLVNFPREHQRKEQKISIPCRSIDSINDEFGPFKNVFIWADVEGAELLIIEGAKKLISSDNVIGFYLEVWNQYQTNNWAQRSEVKKVLNELGYEKEIVITMCPTHGDIIYLKK